MDTQNVISELQTKLDQTVEHFVSSLRSLRTGRANTAMLDGVTVDAYGSQMPLIQVATITVPEAQLIQITPFDPNNLQAIANAIRNNSSLGLNPTDDGRVVRVPIPPLNEERRRDLARQIGQKQEEAMVSLRNARHDALDAIDKAKKDKSLGEDDAKRASQQAEDAVGKARVAIETAGKAKETEIMTL